ncbi:MAG TPA: hemolysin family protein, partial [Myxococcota bacterium]|nr:hemolysin family protein [Myxococcota bacterium]
IMVQVGVTALATAAGSLGGASLAQRLAPVLAEALPLGGSADGVALALVVLSITALCVVLGELVPVAIALRSAEAYLLFFARPLLWLSGLTRPIVWLVDRTSVGVLRRMSAKVPELSDSESAPEELQNLVNEATRSGNVHPQAAEIASRALSFGDLTVADVMVPRNRIKALSINAAPEEIRRVLLEEGHSRMPVYDGTLDQIVGVLVAKDVLALAWERELIVLQDLLQPVYFAPEVMQAVDLLKELQKRRLHFAMAVDELGGTAGIVTLEDLLEELVGEIFGEHDKDGPELIRVEPDGSAVVQGMLPVREANRELRLDLPEGDDFSTLGGLCVSLAGRIPETGQLLRLEDGTVMEVLDASPRRVRLVRIRPADEAGVAARDTGRQGAPLH